MSLLATKERVTARPRQEMSVSKPKPTWSLLVIEDDALICNLLRTILEHRGYVVEFAETYAAGAAAIEATKPRMIILDLALPDGDGLDLLRHLREDLHRTDPVLVLTAFSGEEEFAQAFECGVSDFVTKPFAPRELGDRVERALVN
jgi:DNA-binding response OmpR family regulator